MHGRLFLRVFLGFWLVTIAILASWLVAGRYFDALSLTPPAASERSPVDRGPQQRALLRLLYDLQNLDQDELAPMLQRFERDNKVRVYIIDARDNELRMRDLPGPVRRVAAQVDREKGRGRVVIRTQQGTLFGHRFFREDSGRMRVVIAMPPQGSSAMRHLLENLWLRVLLTIIISGIVCYALSRLMTRRLARLELAAGKLAEGHLDTRIDVRERGGDETDDLARSFNSMAEELQRRIDAQRQLLSDVSHELRSPLARLRIALALAEEDKDNSAHHLSRIDNETERLEELIAQLLGSQSQTPELNDTIDLDKLLSELCEDCRFEGEMESKRVVYSGPRQSALVATHGDLLYKCFDNLLRNALQHSGPGGIIAVSATTVDESVLVTVQDSGPGVPEEELERIFEAFYRVDKARTRSTGGYGLGLSIARRAVAQHGGQIEAENAGGLRITVTLPRVMDPQ